MIFFNTKGQYFDFGGSGRRIKVVLVGGFNCDSGAFLLN